MVFAKLLIASASAVAAVSAWKLIVFILKPQFSGLRSLRGPKRTSFVWGNFKELWKDGQLERWEKEHGSVFVYKIFFNADRVHLSDFRAVNHVLTHSNIFQKPEQSRVLLANILGDGLIVTEGDLHKKQRRILNPCFGPSSIRDLTPIFFEKAIKLQRTWESELGDSANSPKRLDALMWLSRAALDIVGVAGFNYDLGSLNDSDNPDELALAFRQLYHNDDMLNFARLIQTLLPFTRFIPSEFARKEHAARETMLRIGRELLQQRKEGVSADEKDLGKDLLSVLVKANQDTELPEAQRMSDEEVIAQVPTFLVAGHETTSTETAWILYCLCTHLDVQQRLREELIACPTPTPSMDDLNALSYLDAVVRETLRLHPAIPGTARIANKDEDIPVGDGYTDRNGVKRDSVRVRKGEGVFIPILAINQSKAIWGEDASEFKPERWFNIPESASSIPGVFSNTMSFLGGARGCIGYRFAVIEMKALLFTLVRNFEFKLAVPVHEIEKRSVIVARPFVKSEPRAGAQLPLFVRRYRGVQ